MPERKDAVTTGKVEIGFALVIVDRRALRAYLDRGSRDFHHSRERGIHIAAIIFIHFGVEIVSGFDRRVLESAFRLGEALGLNMVGPVEKPVRLEVLEELLSKYKATLVP